MKGFTLVETLVAITILIIAIVGPLYAVHKSVAASYAARDTLIANALAQEGIEYIRGIRDYNYLSTDGSGSWTTGLNNCTGTNGCTIDAYNTFAPVTCSSGNPTGCAPLVLDANGSYRQSGSGTATRFRREINVTILSATELVVTSTVYWSTYKIPYSVSVTERLYNWL